jgi:hypothetical protein
MHRHETNRTAADADVPAPLPISHNYTASTDPIMAQGRTYRRSARVPDVVSLPWWLSITGRADAPGALAAFDEVVAR